jgi:hypothetical protein
MKTGVKSWQVVVLTGAILALFAMQASAQAPVTYGFNNSDFNNGSSPTGFQVGTRNFNPPPMGEAFDYGGFTPTLTYASAYASTTESTFTNTPNSGSIKLSWQFDPADGGASAAFTFDVEPTPGLVATNLSFDLMVDPTSATDTYGGNGYFQVATRDGAYGYNDTGYAEELGNPTYSAPDQGTWEHISIALSGADATVRGITFQDYADGQGTGRPIDGTVAIYIDNISLVPEPGSFVLLGLAAPGLIFAARRYRKSA